MARAKRPVTIAGIEFDALISEEHGYEAITPEEYQQLAEEFIGARPVKNKEDETNGKDP